MLPRVEHLDCHDAAIGIEVKHDTFGDLFALHNRSIGETDVERVSIGVIDRLHAHRLLEHDPEKLQTFRSRSCVKDKDLERKHESTLSDFALVASGVKQPIAASTAATEPSSPGKTQVIGTPSLHQGLPLIAGFRPIGGALPPIRGTF